MGLFSFLKKLFRKSYIPNGDGNFDVSGPLRVCGWRYYFVLCRHEFVYGDTAYLWEDGTIRPFRPVQGGSIIVGDCDNDAEVNIYLPEGLVRGKIVEK